MHKNRSRKSLQKTQIQLFVLIKIIAVKNLEVFCFFFYEPYNSKLGKNEMTNSISSGSCAEPSKAAHKLQKFKANTKYFYSNSTQF